MWKIYSSISIIINNYFINFDSYNKTNIPTTGICRKIHSSYKYDFDKLIVNSTRSRCINLLAK